MQHNFTITFYYFYSLSTKINADKMSPKKELEASQRTSGEIISMEDKGMRTQDGTDFVWLTNGVWLRREPSMASNYNLSSASTKMPQPKIDASDRRQIEAQNEDKSHTTKEALDDIKRVHNKEKRKKEQNNMERCEPGIYAEEWV